MQALLKNINGLAEYCEQQVKLYNDPVNKYCLKKISDQQFRAALLVFNEVVGELADLCKLLQRRNLTTIEAFQFVRAKICKLRVQYLSKDVHWSDEVSEMIDQDVKVSVYV